MLGRTSILMGLVACAACAPPAAKCPVVPPARPPVAAVAETPSDTIVRSGNLGFAVHVRPFANLAYHLDCLAGRRGCSAEAIHTLWDSGWTPDDTAALAEWKAVRDLYEVSVTVGGHGPPTPMPLPHAEVDFDALVRVASLVSDTPEAYRQNLRVLLPPDVAERIAHAAEHFWPRFDRFWKASGSRAGATFKTGLEALFGKGELPVILARALRFYGSPLGQDSLAVIDFDLVVLPVVSPHTSAEQLASHGVIEVVPGEGPEERMDVVCHELFHFFFNTRTPEQQRALLQRFAASADPLAPLAYMLMDEAVATALGNGVVNHAVNPPDYAKRVARDKGFYNVHSIDATAKGLLSRTTEDPTTKAPLDDDATVAALIAATRDAVGAEPAPLEYLRSVAGAAAPGWWHAAMAEVIEKAHANNVYNHDPVDGADAVAMLTDYPLLTSVLILPRAKLASLTVYGDTLPKAARAILAREAKKAGPFVLTVARSPSSWMFVVVGETPGEAHAVAEAFFATPRVKAGVFRSP